MFSFNLKKYPEVNFYFKNFIKLNSIYALASLELALYANIYKIIVNLSKTLTLLCYIC